MNPFRRDLETLLASHVLDPGRCELLVEGEEDRRILLWLIGNNISKDAVITTIDQVEVECTSGGNRERLLELARRLEGAEACILCFVDAGLGPRDPAEEELDRAVLTDGPDIESYLLRPECVEKFLRLGLRSEAWNPEQLLALVLQRGRRLGVLRLASDSAGWRLPFQKTDLNRHVSADSDTDVTVDEDSFIRVLLQNAGLPLTMCDEVSQRRDDLDAELSELDDIQLTHGKDALALLGEVAVKAGAQRKEVRGLLWTSLERRFVAGHSSLERVLSFLETCSTNRRLETASA